MHSCKREFVCLSAGAVKQAATACRGHANSNPGLAAQHPACSRHLPRDGAVCQGPCPNPGLFPVQRQKHLPRDSRARRRDCCNRNKALPGTAEAQASSEPLLAATMKHPHAELFQGTGNPAPNDWTLALPKLPKKTSLRP